MFIKNICWRYWNLSIALVPLLANGMEADAPSMPSKEKAQWLNFFVSNRSPRDDIENEKKWIGTESITIQHPNIEKNCANIKGVGAHEVHFHDLWEHAIYSEDACNVMSLKNFYTRPAIFLCLLKLLKKDIENQAISTDSNSVLFAEFKKYYQAHIFNINKFAESEINIEQFFSQDTVTSVCEKDSFSPTVQLTTTEKPYQVFLNIINEIKTSEALLKILFDENAIAKLNNKSLEVPKVPAVKKHNPRRTKQPNKNFLTSNKAYTLLGGIGIFMILYLSYRFLKA